MIVALAISPFYPIIKKCWTSSFVLLTGGISFLLMALFFMLIDVLKWRKWSFFFRVIGMNSIFIYLFLRIVDINILVSYIFGWSVAVFGEAGAIVPLLGKIVLAWGLLYYMYKKEIFIKV
jgi:predicted acyltransferase